MISGPVRSPLFGSTAAVALWLALFASAAAAQAELEFVRQAERVHAGHSPRWLVHLDLRGAADRASFAPLTEASLRARLYTQELGTLDIERVLIPARPARIEVDGEARWRLASFTMAGGDWPSAGLPAASLELLAAAGDASSTVPVRALAAASEASPAPELISVSFDLDTSALPKEDLALLKVEVVARGFMPGLKDIVQPAARSGGEFEQIRDLGCTALVADPAGTPGSVVWTQTWIWDLRRAVGDQGIRTFRFPTLRKPAQAIRTAHTDATGTRTVPSDSAIVLESGEGLSPLHRLILFGATFVTMLIAVVLVLILGNRSRARRAARELRNAP